MLAAYVYPTTGATTVPANVPTLARMRKLNEVIVDITTDDANVNESPVAIVHNMALAPADGSDGRPNVLVTKLTSAMTALADLKIAFTDLNTITITKNAISQAGAVGVFRVYIKRPNSIER
jgi:hypothetical protein